MDRPEGSKIDERQNIRMFLQGFFGSGVNGQKNFFGTPIELDVMIAIEWYIIARTDGVVSLHSNRNQACLAQPVLANHKQRKLFLVLL